MLLALATMLAVTACQARETPEAEPAVDAGDRPVTVFGHEVVNTWPHDTGAFTQGLLFRDGFLFESTGLNGRSSLRRVVLGTGTVIKMHRLERRFFGEGLTDWGDTLIQLTWRENTGFVYDINTFEEIKRFEYPGQGWGLTHDGKRLIMSDGTPHLRFLDPDTLTETGRVEVRIDGQPLSGLNELEYIEGEVFANVFPGNHVVIIDPESGRVTGRVDLGDLLTPEQRARTDVLNGIAYDAEGKRIFVTGKYWPTLFEIRLTPPTGD